MKTSPSILIDLSRWDNLLARSTFAAAIAAASLLPGFASAQQSDSVADSKQPAASPEGEVAVDTNTTLPDGKLTLDRCLEIALEHNFDIRKAKERIEKQYNVRLEARSIFLPSLGVAARYEQQDRDRIPSFNGNTFGSTKSWNADIKATQVLYAGGKGFADLRRSKLLEQAAEEDLRAAINNTMSLVKQLYYDVLLAEAEVDVEQQNIGLFEEQLKSEQSKQQAGMVSDFNVLRAEVDLANRRTPLIRAKNRVKLAWEELRRGLGIGAEDSNGPALPPALEGKLKFEPFSVDLRESLAKAEQNRPELKSAKLLIDAQSQSVESQRSGYFPTLSVYALYGADKSQFSDELDDELHGWRAGAEASWNIFDGFATTGRVGQAQSDLSQARISYDQARQDISVEVRRVYSSLLEAKELVNASTKVTQQAAESLRLAVARYDTGAATYLDTLDTRVALTQARTNEVQALHDYNVVVAQMERAIGIVTHP
ncbi:MAG: TolC family protein [Bdellovibrionota bacterium]